MGSNQGNVYDKTSITTLSYRSINILCYGGYFMGAKIRDHQKALTSQGPNLETYKLYFRNLLYNITIFSSSNIYQPSFPYFDSRDSLLLPQRCTFSSFPRGFSILCFRIRYLFIIKKNTSIFKFMKIYSTFTIFLFLLFPQR